MDNIQFPHDSLSDEQKMQIKQVRDCYIGSPNLDSILAEINRCRTISRDCGGRPECMIIFGEPGAGKNSSV